MKKYIQQLEEAAGEDGIVSRLGGDNFVLLFRKKNLDQVTRVIVPRTTGYSDQYYNTSEQFNTGVEFTLGATLLKINDFRWRITGNIAYNYNELLKYDPPVKSLTSSNYVGYPLGNIFTGKSMGIDPQTGLYDFEMRPDVTIKTIEDYRKYQNYLFYVGTSNAPWTGGFSTSFSYKNFSVNLVGNFSLGGKVINDIVSPVSFEKAGEGVNEQVQSSRSDLYVNHLNVVRDVTYRWTPSNPIIQPGQGALRLPEKPGGRYLLCRLHRLWLQRRGP